MTMLEQLRADIQKVLEERAGKQTKLDELRSQADKVLEGAQARGDGVLTEDETRQLNEARDASKTIREELRALDERRESMEQRVDEIEEADRAREAAERSAERFGGTKPTASVHVTRDEPVYRKGGGHSFFRDAYRRSEDPLAWERIVRHQRQMQDAVRAGDEERAASASGDFGALVVPQFLVEDFAPVAHAGRRFANVVTNRPLPPEGMTLNVPRGRTSSLVGSQASENSSVTTRTYTVEDIVVPVVTVGGFVDVSRQSIDRGRNTDDVVMQDLAESYATEINRQVISGDGTGNTHFGVLSTTGIGSITVTSTTASVQIRMLAEGIADINENRFIEPTVIVVHPRRWGYWSQEEDANKRPLIVPQANGPQNALAVGDLSGVRFVGEAYGLPILTDPTLPTTLSFDVTEGSTTDPIVVTRASDLRLYEDDVMPNRVRFEETVSDRLSVRIVAWDYSGFTAARFPSATIVLQGSGLTTPTFVS